MGILEKDMSEVERKNKKIMNIIMVLILVILLASFAIIGLMFYLQQAQFKFYIDGKETANYAQDLFIFEEDKIYISIKDIASLVGYRAYNGAYGGQYQYSEDITKCYVESSNEIASFELHSNIIYKTPSDKNDYEYFYIDEPVKQINNKLYTTIEGISRAYNLGFSYSKDSNQVTVYTLPYLVTNYSTNILNASIDDNFNNQKALLYNLIIVSNETSTSSNNIRYGISSLNGVEIVGTKYKNIEFIESTQEFIVTTTDNKMGIITSSGITKVQPQYDNLKQVDKDLNLYLATNNGKQGIIEENGKILIYIEYDKIGIDTSAFYTNDIKNPYLLYGNCIPVCKNGKWGMYDKTGKIILPIEYDSIGCIADNEDINANNVAVIPDIKGIVVHKNYNQEMDLYGVVNYLGREILPMVLSSIYSETSEGRQEYKMKNAGNTFNLIEYVNKNINLDTINNE